MSQKYTVRSLLVGGAITGLAFWAACSAVEQTPGVLATGGQVATSAASQPGLSTKTSQTVSKVGKDLTIASQITQPLSQPGVGTDLGTTLVAAGQVTQGASSLTGPAAGYIWLGGLALSLLGNLILVQKNKQTTAAATANQTGLTAAVAAGQLSVGPLASTIVDQHTPDHPISNNLVDALANAAPTKPATNVTLPTITTPPVV